MYTYGYNEKKRFAFDPRKSEANLEKHGIDFEEAQALWLDLDCLRVPARRRGERRYMLVALLSGEHWSAIATDRGQTTRIISVRRSTAKEIEAYEERRQDNAR